MLTATFEIQINNLIDPTNFRNNEFYLKFYATMGGGDGVGGRQERRAESAATLIKNENTFGSIRKGMEI